jgi:hypothetical protein
MPQASFVPLEIPPGVVKVESSLSQEGRFIDADHVRFVRGKPEKIGGWTLRTATSVEGVPRGMHAWLDAVLSPYYAVGTSVKLFVYDASNVKSDITPDRETGTLTNPFSTTSGSATVTVTDTGHGLISGDEVSFSGASAVGGITVSGVYKVNTVPTSGSYTITHSSAASSTAGPGGGSVSYAYEIGIGYEDAVLGLGWGAGPWGGGTWGTARTASSLIFEPRVWSLDNFGQILIASPTGGGIYSWSPADPPGTIAAVLSGAPTTCRGVFVTGERFITALGVDGDPMKFAWASQASLTTWTPSSTNTANIRTLAGGSKLMAGARLGNGTNLIWSDSNVFLHQYTGSRLVYTTRSIGENCGLVGPLAKTTVNGVAFWMSPAGFYMSGGGAPVPIPNNDDISDFVFDNITEMQKFKCFATFIELHDEVWFHYPAGDDEPNRYVVVNITDFRWSCGTLERTSSTRFQSGNTRPIMATEAGAIYNHEDGVDAAGSALQAYVTWAPVSMNGQYFEMQGVAPDMQRQTGSVTLDITAYDRLRITAIDSESLTIAPTDALVDCRVSGRHLSMTLTSNVVGGDFRMGKMQIEIRPMGSRR